MADPTISIAVAHNAAVVQVIAGPGANAPGIRGTLVSVTVDVAGTSQALTLYDNSAGAASGKILGVVPSGATAGQIFAFNTVFENGVTTSASTNNPDVTISLAV